MIHKKASHTRIDSCLSRRATTVGSQHAFEQSRYKKQVVSALRTSHMAGTFWLNRDVPISSSSVDMTTRPFRAFWTEDSEDAMTAIRRLYRRHSCKGE
jgi:hypothetical protein